MLVTTLVGLAMGADAFAADSGGLAEKRPAEAEVRAFVERFVAALNARDGSVLDGVFDLDALMERVMRGPHGRPEVRAGFADGLRSYFSIGQQLVAKMSKGTCYTLIRLKAKDDRYFATCRLLGTEGSLNYHEWEIVADTDGGLRVVDGYVYMMGERFSETLRRTFLAAAMAADPDLADCLPAWVRDFTQNTSTWQKMVQLGNTGNPQEAEKIYASMPASLKKVKMFQICRIVWTSSLSEVEYEAAIHDFAELFPNDPALDLLSIDGYFMRKQYSKVLEVVDRLDKRVGGDPYLNVVRGHTLLMMEKPLPAKAMYGRAIKAEPGLTAAYQGLLQVSVAQKNHAQTARLLTLLKEKFGATISDLKADPQFAAFVKSNAYKKWLLRQGAAPAPSAAAAGR